MSVIRGHHVYKCVSTPAVAEELVLQAEYGNKYDHHAVEVMKDGYVLMELASKFHVCTVFS